MNWLTNRMFKGFYSIGHAYFGTRNLNCETGIADFSFTR